MLIRHSYETMTTRREGQGMSVAMVSTETDENIDHNRERHQQDSQKGHFGMVQSSSMGETSREISSGNVVDNDSGHGLIECSICLVVFEQGSTVITVTYCLLTHLVSVSHRHNETNSPT